MSERPIIFSAPMVRAILEGRKTQTRRVLSPQPTLDGIWWWRGDMLAAWRDHAIYAPGDTLWVREAFAEPDENHVIYRADWSDETLAKSDKMRRQYRDIARAYPNTRWRPSIHMPRRVARIFLLVTGVRVERLQDISNNDCYDEGTLQWADAQNPRHSDGTPAKWPSVRHAFVALWDSINAKRGHGWDTNPWVWRIEFERIGL